MTPSTIGTLQGLGYTVGIATGSVQVEEDALAAAVAAAEPAVVAADVQVVTTQTLADLDASGKLPDTAEKRQALAATIAAAALDAIIERVTSKVDFHQRAVDIAKTMPDIWHIGQTVDVGDGTQRVVSIYVACKEDGTGWDDDAQAQLDALAHQPSFDERIFQAQNPDAMQAAQQLASDGKTVTRETGAETFIVDGQTLDATQIVALADTPA